MDQRKIKRLSILFGFIGGVLLAVLSLFTVGGSPIIIVIAFVIGLIIFGLISNWILTRISDSTYRRRKKKKEPREKTVTTVEKPYSSGTVYYVEGNKVLDGNTRKVVYRVNGSDIYAGRHGKTVAFRVFGDKIYPGEEGIIAAYHMIDGRIYEGETNEKLLYVIKTRTVYK